MCPATLGTLEWLRMTRFVFITQIVDPDHPALGATVAKIRALAARVDEVAVLALDGVPDALPANCQLLTFGANSRPARVARFGSAITSACRPRPLAVLAHMAPVYAVLAAPWCRPRRVPLLLWYTHWRANTMLRVGLYAADAVVSVDRRSFPLPSPKVAGIGHGIEVEDFPCLDRPVDTGMLRLLSLGRYSAAKGLDTVIRAVGILPEAVLTHHGPVLTAEEATHRVELEHLVEVLGLTSRVTLGDAIPRRAVPREFALADALVNNMRAGAPDKVVFEAAASCLPVFASNPVFDNFLPPSLRFPRDDAAALAAQLAEFAPADRVRTGHELRNRVVAEHSSEHWADAVLAVAHGVHT
jgi:glycosyltransferase involved in cell wall biosynthesis